MLFYVKFLKSTHPYITIGVGVKRIVYKC